MLLVVGAVTYGVPRILRPDMYAGEAFVPGLLNDLDRAFLHLDFGCSIILRGCPSIPDFPLLCALGLWGAVLLIVLGLIADGIVARFDPRVRTSPGRAW